MLELVGLAPDVAALFPHEFSGGQRQRIAIARALATDTRLIVLDEPVSALDVSVRAQIINQLEHLQRTLGVSYLFIGHDLATVAHISHRIAVMYLGKIVETADSDALCARPMHPYTKALFAAALPSHPDDPPHERTDRRRGPERPQPPPGLPLPPALPGRRCRSARRSPSRSCRAARRGPGRLPPPSRARRLHSVEPDLSRRYTQSRRSAAAPPRRLRAPSLARMDAT